MTKKIKNILFASDLSVEMAEVFEHAVAMAAYYDAGIVVLHVMEEASNSSEKRVRMAFGEDLYEKLKTQHKDGAMNLLSGKNVDAMKIRKAIAGFLEDQDKGSDSQESDSLISKILVTESQSIADAICSNAMDED